MCNLNAFDRLDKDAKKIVTDKIYSNIQVLFSFFLLFLVFLLNFQYYFLLISYLLNKKYKSPLTLNSIVL